VVILNEVKDPCISFCFASANSHPLLIALTANQPMKKTTPDQIDDILAQLWRKNLPVIRERLDLMDKLAAAAASGTLDEPTRIEALGIAHKLAGSLGMYGYPQGTEVASKIERILKSPTPETLAMLHTLATDLRKSLAAGL
jgi:HPt (histidine-containing phosphotransfer) domain-containing protein